MRSLKWALIQYDLCPYKKRKFGHRYIQKEDHVKTQKDGELESHSYKPGMQEMSGSNQKLEKKHGEQFIP